MNGRAIVHATLECPRAVAPDVQRRLARRGRTRGEVVRARVTREGVRLEVAILGSARGITRVLLEVRALGVRVCAADSSAATAMGPAAAANAPQ